jgi:protein-disulfide isomerase
MRILPIGSLFVAAAFAQAPAGIGVDKLVLEKYIRHLLLYPPEAQVVVDAPQPSEVPGLLQVKITATLGQAGETRTYYVTADGSKIIEGRSYDLGQNPFKRELDLLDTRFRPSIGTAGAPVVIVLFTDFQCPYCQKEADEIRKNLLTAFPTQVRLYFMDFPLTSIHKYAMDAALSGRCVFNRDALAFWEFHDWVFAKQSELSETNFKQKRNEWLVSKSIDPSAIDQCMGSPGTIKAIDTSIKLGRDLGVQSTPTLFVNGRKLGGALPFANLKQIIEAEIGYQATARNAGENCCTLPAPSPIPQQDNPVLPRIVPKK